MGRPTPPAPAPPVLDERCITERFVRASGPGGQNVNKVATAVELRFDIPQSSLPPDVQRRLIALAGHRMRPDGSLVIDSHAFRTQLQNREAARKRLAGLVAQAMTPPRPRRPTRPKKAAKENRLSAKKQRGLLKSTRARRGSDE